MRIAPRRSRSACRTLKRAVWRAHKLAPGAGAGVRLRLSRLRPHGRLPSLLPGGAAAAVKRPGKPTRAADRAAHLRAQAALRVPPVLVVRGPQRRGWAAVEAAARVVLRALGEALDPLLMEKRVSARWRVVLTYSDADNPQRG